MEWYGNGWNGSGMKWQKSNGLKQDGILCVILAHTVKSDGKGSKNRAVTTIVSDVGSTIFITRQ